MILHTEIILLIIIEILFIYIFMENIYYIQKTIFKIIIFMWRYATKKLVLMLIYVLTMHLWLIACTYY